MLLHVTYLRDDNPRRAFIQGIGKGKDAADRVFAEVPYGNSISETDGNWKISLSMGGKKIRTCLSPQCKSAIITGKS